MEHLSGLKLISLTLTFVSAVMIVFCLTLDFRWKNYDYLKDNVISGKNF